MSSKPFKYYIYNIQLPDSFIEKLVNIDYIKSLDIDINIDSEITANIDKLFDYYNNTNINNNRNIITDIITYEVTLPKASNLIRLIHMLVNLKYNINQQIYRDTLTSNAQYEYVIKNEPVINSDNHYYDFRCNCYIFRYFQTILVDKINIHENLMKLSHFIKSNTILSLVENRDTEIDIIHSCIDREFRLYIDTYINQLVSLKIFLIYQLFNLVSDNTIYKNIMENVTDIDYNTYRFIVELNITIDDLLESIKNDDIESLINKLKSSCNFCDMLFGSGTIMNEYFSKNLKYQIYQL